MTGKIDIELQTPLITYHMSLLRNITMIRGDSGSGKSYLCELLQQAIAGEEDIKVTLSQSVNYLVMPENTLDSRVSKSWSEIIQECQDTVIFIDETCDCWKSGIFSKIIQNTTNYYVIFSRGTHSDISYSVDSILYFDKTMSDIGPHIYSKQIKLEPVFSHQITPELIVAVK